MHALTWHNKSCAHVLHLKYLFIFSFRFWQQTLFLWHLNFYCLFQIKFLCKIKFGSVSDDTSVELENSVHWQSLVLYFISLPILLCFLLVKSARSPYLHGKLINWTIAFYFSFSCTVLRRILNILISMNRIFQLFLLANYIHAFSYVILYCMVFVSSG